MSDSSALPVSGAAGEPNGGVSSSNPGRPVGDTGELVDDSSEEASAAREPAGRGDPWNTFAFKRRGGLEGRTQGKPAQVREENEENEENEEDTAGSRDRSQ